MDLEELSHGAAEPARVPLGGWIGLALASVLAGVAFMVLNGPPPVEPGPRPGLEAPGLAARPPGVLSIGAVCPPVTDGPDVLAVSFELQNLSGSPLTLLDVQPVPPAGGLSPTGVVTAGGSCRVPGVDRPGGLLRPEEIQLITLRFDLPAECPQPYPVQVRVGLRAEQMVGTTTAPVRRDLGEVRFDTCPRDGLLRDVGERLAGQGQPVRFGTQSRSTNR